MTDRAWSDAGRVARIRQHSYDKPPTNEQLPQLSQHHRYHRPQPYQVPRQKQLLSSQYSVPPEQQSTTMTTAADGQTESISVSTSDYKVAPDQSSYQQWPQQQPQQAIFPQPFPTQPLQALIVCGPPIVTEYGVFQQAMYGMPMACPNCKFCWILQTVGPPTMTAPPMHIPMPMQMPMSMPTVDQFSMPMQTPAVDPSSMHTSIGSSSELQPSASLTEQTASIIPASITSISATERPVASIPVPLATASETALVVDSAPSLMPPVTQPMPPVTQPMPPVTLPMPSVTQPMPTVTQPMPTVTQPMPSVPQPLPSVTQPTTTVTQPTTTTVTQPSSSAESKSTSIAVSIPPSLSRQVTFADIVTTINIKPRSKTDQSLESQTDVAARIATADIQLKPSDALPISAATSTTAATENRRWRGWNVPNRPKPRQNQPVASSLPNSTAVVPADPVPQAAASAAIPAAIESEPSTDLETGQTVAVDSHNKNNNHNTPTSELIGPNDRTEDESSPTISELSHAADDSAADPIETVVVIPLPTPNITRSARRRRNARNRQKAASATDFTDSVSTVAEVVVLSQQLPDVAEPILTAESATVTNAEPTTTAEPATTTEPATTDQQTTTETEPTTTIAVSKPIPSKPAKRGRYKAKKRPKKLAAESSPSTSTDLASIGPTIVQPAYEPTTVDAKSIDESKTAAAKSADNPTTKSTDESTTAAAEPKDQPKTVDATTSIDNNSSLWPYQQRAEPVIIEPVVIEPVVIEQVVIDSKTATTETESAVESAAIDRRKKSFAAMQAESKRAFDRDLAAGKLADCAGQFAIYVRGKRRADLTKPTITAATEALLKAVDYKQNGFYVGPVPTKQDVDEPTVPVILSSMDKKQRAKLKKKLNRQKKKTPSIPSEPSESPSVSSSTASEHAAAVNLLRNVTATMKPSVSTTQPVSIESTKFHITTAVRNDFLQFCMDRQSVITAESRSSLIGVPIAETRLPTPSSLDRSSDQRLTSFRLRTRLKYATITDIFRFRKLAPASIRLLKVILSAIGEDDRIKELITVSTALAFIAATSPTEQFILFVQTPKTENRRSFDIQQQSVRRKWKTTAADHVRRKLILTQDAMKRRPFDERDFMERITQYSAAVDMLDLLTWFCDDGSFTVLPTKTVVVPAKPMSVIDRRRSLSSSFSAADAAADPDETDTEDDNEDMYQPMFRRLPVVDDRPIRPTADERKTDDTADRAIKRMFGADDDDDDRPTKQTVTKQQSTEDEADEDAPRAIPSSRRSAACAYCGLERGPTPTLACNDCLTFVCSEGCHVRYKSSHTMAACDDLRKRLSDIVADLSGGDRCAGCDATANQACGRRHIQSCLPAAFGDTIRTVNNTAVAGLYPGYFGMHSAAAARQRRLFRSALANNNQKPSIVFIILQYCDMRRDWFVHEAPAGFHRIMPPMDETAPVAADDVNRISTCCISAQTDSLFIRCRFCASVIYCSSACQTDDIASHRRICRPASIRKAKYAAGPVPVLSASFTAAAAAAGRDDDAKRRMVDEFAKLYIHNGESPPMVDLSTGTSIAASIPTTSIPTTSIPTTSTGPPVKTSTGPPVKTSTGPPVTVPAEVVSNVQALLAAAAAIQPIGVGTDGMPVVLTAAQIAKNKRRNQKKRERTKQKAAAVAAAADLKLIS